MFIQLVHLVPELKYVILDQMRHDYILPPPHSLSLYGVVHSGFLCIETLVSAGEGWAHETYNIDPEAFPQGDTTGARDEEAVWWSNHGDAALVNCLSCGPSCNAGTETSSPPLVTLFWT